MPGGHGLTTHPPHTPHGPGSPAARAVAEQTLDSAACPWGARGDHISQCLSAARSFQPTALPGGRLTSREVLPSIGLWEQPVPCQALGPDWELPSGSRGGWRQRQGPPAEAEKSRLKTGALPGARTHGRAGVRGGGENAAPRGQGGVPGLPRCPPAGKGRPLTGVCGPTRPGGRGKSHIRGQRPSGTDATTKLEETGKSSSNGRSRGGRSRSQMAPG